MNINLTTTVRRTVATVAAAMALSTFAAGTASAGMSGAADVECNNSYNTIAVTPHVLSDHDQQDQYTATRVWIATWTGSRWEWQANSWKVELASKRQNPMGGDTSRLTTQTFDAADGYHFVYVQSYMWDGQRWYSPQGEYTRTYTNVTTSISHEPNSRAQGSYCIL